MPLKGEYLGMPVSVGDLDRENQTFFRYCGDHELRLQRCEACGKMRTPPTTACPFCSGPDATWVPVSGRGTLYSYGEVHHAIQPVFRQFAPYLLLLVELDEQRGEPGEHDGLRFIGNLASEDGELASPEQVSQVGIGTRLKVVFKDVGEGIAQPLWMVDAEADQPANPWRYPIE